MQCEMRVGEVRLCDMLTLKRTRIGEQRVRKLWNDVRQCIDSVINLLLYFFSIFCSVYILSGGNTSNSFWFCSE
jgi:hypothetical protein